MTADPGDDLEVWIDQEECTGDGLCVEMASDVFEFDIDGLAYVKGADGELRTESGARVDVPPERKLDVIGAAKDCPGDCIYVVRRDGTPVAGPQSN